MSDIVKRKLQRVAFCRGCDDEMKSGTEVISTYSFRNRGQHIYFCLNCAQTIGTLVKTKQMILIRNNVDGYPSTQTINEPFKESLVDYFNAYGYNDPDQLADELISTGEIDIGDSSCTNFILENV